MTSRSPLPSSVRVQARQVSVLRLVLLALGGGVAMILTSGGHHLPLVEPAASRLFWLLVIVGVLAIALMFTVGWARWRWQLVLHLIFDLVWTGFLLDYSGGVDSPGVTLLFIIVLVGTLVLPGVAPFVLPTMASLVLALIAALYLAGHVPFSSAFLTLNPGLINTDHIVGMLITQVAAIFLVDLLGQILARRLYDQQIFTGVLLDQLGEGVLAIDRSGSIAYANAESLRLLGLNPGIHGRPVAQVLAAGSLAPVLSLITGQDCPALERFVGPQDRLLVLRVSELVDSRLRPIGRTLLIADETRLQILEDSAHRAEHLAALGEMAAGIAHEVRNPLTSLRGCAQELAGIAAGAGRPDAETLARIMMSEADRLARIVDDFLSMSRLRSPERERLSLSAIFTELEELYRTRSDLPPGLALRFAAAEDCPPLQGDPGQIRQVLTNLLNNSIDAVRQVAAPAVTCSAGPASTSSPLGATSIELRVADNGIGIPADLQAQVFTPFFSTKSKGTGLGLSLVQRIVREHEGFLHLVSSPGVGTTIVIYFPSLTQTRVFKRALGGS